MKKPSVPREMLKIRATSSEPFFAMAAVQRTAISVSSSIGSPKATSSARMMRFLVFESSRIWDTFPRMKLTPSSRARL